MKRIIVVVMGLLLIMCLAGCKKEKQYSYDGIIIEIKSTYKSKFLNKEFELNDFNFQNIETYSYSKWYDTKNRGYIFKENRKTRSRRSIATFQTIIFCRRM